VAGVEPVASCSCFCGPVIDRAGFNGPNEVRHHVKVPSEWSRLYQIAKPHLRPVLLTAYQLGQRFSEIVGLTWDRVDVKRGFITLRSLDTKTKTARQVPMTPDVKVTLQRLAKVRSLTTAATEAASRQVFTYEGRPLQRVTRSFKTVL
jgi:integrase